LFTQHAVSVFGVSTQTHSRKAAKAERPDRALREHMESTAPEPKPLRNGGHRGRGGRRPGAGRKPNLPEAPGHQGDYGGESSRYPRQIARKITAFEEPEMLPDVRCGYRPVSKIQNGILLCDVCIAKLGLPALIKPRL